MHDTLTSGICLCCCGRANAYWKEHHFQAQRDTKRAKRAFEWPLHASPTNLWPNQTPRIVTTGIERRCGLVLRIGGHNYRRMGNYEFSMDLCHVRIGGL